MDFGLTPDREALVREAAALAGRFSHDYWREKDRAEEYPGEFVGACAAAGWFGTIVPREYGGRGLGVTEAALLLHEICRAGAGTSGASPVHLAIFPPFPIIRHGSEAMRARYLPRLASGELRMAFGVTEAAAGSDTSRIETRAERRGDRWVLNGTKAWLSNGQHAQKALILARTAPRDPSRPLLGLTLFFADLDPARCTLEVIDKLGRNAVDSNRLTMHDLEVAAADVVGEVGRGFYHLLDGLNPERIVIAMEAIGIGRAALALASSDARERLVFDRPVGQNQAIAHPLARAWADLAAAELLAMKAAWLFDRGQPCGAEANAAKLLGAEAGFAACEAAMQTLGGRGYRKDFHVERWWREVRLYKIAPITQEMVLNYLAEHVLGLPKSY
ncbi:MAG TPA: acyl-CoA dehydrogenase family protein [Thermomicrobiaceae bacterium]|nr:acyl-CoA dehydrogenase family protein [Thermomicrobiaceae bacterium]